jgi:hypothetical protein
VHEKTNPPSAAINSARATTGRRHAFAHRSMAVGKGICLVLRFGIGFDRKAS